MLIANGHDDIGFDVADRVEDGYASPLEAFEEIYAPRMDESGLQLQFYTVGGDVPRFCGDGDLTAGTFRRLDLIREIVRQRDDFIIVRTRSDLDRVVAGEVRGLVLTIEGALPLGERDLSVLRNMSTLGLGSVDLLWFKANQVGDGVNEVRQAGLTNFGRRVVEEMNRLGMLVDVVQACPQTVSDVLDLSTAPILVSHSNASGQHEHIRNMTDDQINRIAEGGGLIGVSTYAAHVSNDSPNRGKLLDHIDYIIDLVGPDHVCFGLNILPAHAREMAAFFKQSEIEFTDFELDGLEDITSLPAALDDLRARGHSDEVVAKVAGQNLVRVLSEILPE